VQKNHQELFDVKEGGRKMSKLIALAFDDPYKADEARAALHRMEGEGLLEMDETAVIVATKKQVEGKSLSEVTALKAASVKLHRTSWWPPTMVLLSVLVAASVSLHRTAGGLLF
jgi:uncharacterized membrane protein